MTNPMPDLEEWWGLGIADVARALDVGQRSIRQARDNHGDDAVYEAARKLNDYLATVYRAGRTEPAAWMSSPIIEGFQVTRWDLYAAGRIEDLYRNAEGRLADDDMLAAFDPDWRRTYWTSHKTVQAEDGGTSIVGKSYDDVVRQVSGQ